ncbi:AAEL008775-PA [Aedes aegypti]|uniref:AAEL008775-PA n=1 Tax=Aedes aegypti TaxID=7159 RepID=Q16XS4_AEDAE|nr:AAEL008775-PA [Aedes aegypti]
MLKIICILALTISSVISIPVETTTGSKGLERPSPINPDVISEPKPKEASTSTPDLASSTPASHIQKIPAKGAKLSSEVDQQKQTLKRDSIKEDQLTRTTTSKSSKTESPSTASTPESHKFSDDTTKKVRREVESSETSTNRSTTTTRAPILSNADENDNTPPHFIRPVPVDQILKNIHDAPKHHEPSQVVSLHDHVTSIAPTTIAPTDSEDVPKSSGDHKLHHAYKNKKNDDQSSEEDSTSGEDEKDQ